MTIGWKRTETKSVEYAQELQVRETVGLGISSYRTAELADLKAAADAAGYVLVPKLKWEQLDRNEQVAALDKPIYPADVRGASVWGGADAQWPSSGEATIDARNDPNGWSRP